MKDETVERLNGWGSVWRFLTPCLLTIALFILTQVRDDVREVSQRIYAHQTNEEIHLPRSEVVRFEGQLQEMRREIIATIRGRPIKGAEPD